MEFVPYIALAIVVYTVFVVFFIRLMALLRRKDHVALPE